MTRQTYAVIGTGAVGGFYGAKLQKSGFQVHFLLRSDYDWVQQNGLSVQSPEGNFHLDNIEAYQTTTEMPQCDVVIVALKTTQNSILPTLLPSILKPNSTLLILQNGLGNEEAIATALGQVTNIDRLTLLGGLCFLCANKLQPGLIQHLDYGHIKLGQYAPSNPTAEITPTLKQLSSDFAQANISTELSNDLLLERWKKLVWNIPFNGLSVLLNAQTNELIADAQILGLVQSLMTEITQTAAAYGRNIPPDFVQYLLELTAKMFPYRTSMKLDFDAGRAMEIETMFGNPLKAAQHVQISTPKLEMLYLQLQFLNRRIVEMAK